MYDNLFYSHYLQNLEIIDFSHNNITHLPDKLFHSPYLQNLQDIYLRHNQIDVSHNLLTAQQTYFIYMKEKISGSLDLSENKISKFEMVGEFAKYVLDPNIAVPLGR